MIDHVDDCPKMGHPVCILKTPPENHHLHLWSLAPLSNAIHIRDGEPLIQHLALTSPMSAYHFWPLARVKASKLRSICRTLKKRKVPEGEKGERVRSVCLSDRMRGGMVGVPGQRPKQQMAFSTSHSHLIIVT